MADTDILKSLRDHVLDESEPLAGLLRKCLALGAVTESDQLRAWATNELNGYPDDAPVPAYRQLHAQLLVDSTSGPRTTRREPISLVQVPQEFRHYIPERLDLRHPIEELAELASSEKAVHMASGGFSVAVALWTQKLQLENMFQTIDALYYSVSPSTLVGIVGRIRTALVEIVIDLAKDVPLDKLPSQARVDSVVQVHIGSQDNYEVNVGGSNSGVIGQGSGFTQSQTTSIPSELTALITQMRDSLADVQDDEQRADAEQAIDDFEESLTEENPNPEKIKRRSRALEKVATTVGSAVLSGVAREGVAAALEHFHLLM
ncbi:hypothetical protein [Mycobacterium asiaticum]|uniref:AbiTii domain-containing protein n=1 Tax=Mycobacterium asiaticum TaxID=1790 RepID=UPI0012DAFE4C|nr:hypothetical protein [Mycobacterium asiaticum]